MKNSMKTKTIVIKCGKPSIHFFTKKSADANSPPNNIKINSKICDNQLAMAEPFNNFFRTIGKHLAGKMESNSSQSVTRYLTNRVSSSIFLEPVDEEK